MKQKIKITHSVDELAQYFGQLLADLILETPKSHFFTIALSGGSTPKAVFKFLASRYKNHIDWEKVLIFWGDERCVPPENDESNFKMTKESLLEHVPITENHIFRIKGEAVPHAEAVRYSKLAKEHIPCLDGIRQFDFIMLGLGEDGHTASIFPDNLSLFHSEKYYSEVTHPQTGQKRISLSGKLINKAKNVVFLVTGDSKAEMVATILQKKKGWESLPASRVNPLNGELTWLLDERAASKLSPNFRH